MFNKLRGLFSREKSLKVRIVATMLIVTLTFANIILLATYISGGAFSYRNGYRLKNTRWKNQYFKY